MNFSMFAANNNKVKRYKYEEKHPLRGEFQRDRDRILYSKAFRRLAGKTQVFLAIDDDHIRNRLTHTLEVSQIATTIAKSLQLDENLTEAIALGHDIGHTPFGHVGERTLNYIMNGCYGIRNYNKNIGDKYKGFKHNWQSIRVICKLEEKTLNLTDHTLWGIINHSNIKYNECKANNKGKCNLKHEEETCNQQGGFSLKFYDEDLKDMNSLINFENCWNFEGFTVRIADEIAQRHHDIEDALEYKIILSGELIGEIRNTFCNSISLDDMNVLRGLENKSRSEQLSVLSRFIVNTLTTDVINNSKKRLKEILDVFRIKDSEEFYNKKSQLLSLENGNYIKNIINFSEDMKKADIKLGEFLRNRVLNSFKAQRMDGVGKYIIRELFKAYIDNPQQLPDKTIVSFYKNLKGEGGLVDYKVNNEISVGKLRDKLEKDHYKIYDEPEYIGILQRTICDYIAGMTDRYAIEEHKKLYNSN